jgi:hypothetical protein
MPTTNFNRQILDLKRWEQVTPLPAATVAALVHRGQSALPAAAVVRSRHDRGVPVPAAGRRLGAGAFAEPSPVRSAAGASCCSGAMSTGTTTAASTLTATGGSDLNDRHEPDARPRPARLQHPHRERPQRRRHADDQQQHNRRDRHHHRSLRRPLRSRPRRCTVSMTPGVVRRRARAHSPAGSFRKYDFATNTWTTLSEHRPAGNAAARTVG